MEKNNIWYKLLKQIKNRIKSDNGNRYIQIKADFEKEDEELNGNREEVSRPEETSG